ncbi:Interleukin-21 receptor [Saguinus oedipus]|uniref:Interleukin-21 receptor n=1 Tax=Saguinus oedipus TaxID=9490 RepID=A0ABQ9UWJ8_SAGOE|nr:Interleukin-21 receptor [Saguinus oedipus]
MDTFDSGFVGTDCSSPVECDFTSPGDEGPLWSYLHQWVVILSPLSSPGLGQLVRLTGCPELATGYRALSQSQGHLGCD